MKRILIIEFLSIWPEKRAWSLLSQKKKVSFKSIVMLMLETYSSVEPQPQHLKTKKRENKTRRLLLRTARYTTGPYSQPLLLLCCHFHLLAAIRCKRKSPGPAGRRPRFQFAFFWYELAVWPGASHCLFGLQYPSLSDSEFMSWLLHKETVIKITWT